MSDKPFIKFYPSDFLAGTSGLSPAERGVYITVLCLIYERDGAIDRDDARLSRRCGAPKAAFIRILTALIDEGKITEEDGMLSNRRAEKALVDRQNRSQNATHAAHSRWNAQSEKSEQNQQTDDAGAMPEQCGEICQPEPEPDSKIKAKAFTKKRGSRLPDDWVLPKPWGEWARGEGYDDITIRREAAQFRDYWCSMPGQKANKVDWLATWRTWMRKVPKPSPASSGGFSQPKKQMSHVEWMKRAGRIGQ